MENDIKVILEVLKSNYNLGADNSLIQFHNKKSVFNDKLVQGHYAIIPTGKFAKMTKDETIVYDAIVKRFLSCFMPKATFEEFKISLLLDKKTNLELTSVSEGQLITPINHEVRDINKKPPKAYTETTLLKAMQTCGKKVEDEETILQGFTIGTSSTRAETLTKLRDNNYVVLKGKSLRMSDFGNKVVENFPAKVFFNVDFTGKIEKNLRKIELGEVDPVKIENDIITFTQVQFKKLLQADVEPLGTANEILGKCPLCGGDIVENKKAFSCINTIDHDCIMTLWKEDKFLKAWGINLTKTRVLSLISNGYFKVKGKNKKLLTVSVIINDELGKLNYKIDK